MAYLDSTKDIKENPYGKRLFEGWQLCRINSVRLSEFEERKSIILDVENEYGMYGQIWLDNSLRARPRILELETSLGLAHGEFLSPEEAHAFYEEHCKDKEVDIRAGWSKDGTKSYVNQIAEAGSHLDTDSITKEPGETATAFAKRQLDTCYSVPKETSAEVADTEKPLAPAKVAM